LTGVLSSERKKHDRKVSSLSQSIIFKAKFSIENRNQICPISQNTFYQELHGDIVGAMRANEKVKIQILTVVVIVLQ
jgi:hypothetical protein